MKQLEKVAEQLLGKTIVGVVGIDRPEGLSRLFLVFDDDTHYEIYARTGMDGSSRLAGGEFAAVRASASRSDPSAHTFGVMLARPPDEGVDPPDGC